MSMTDEPLPIVYEESHFLLVNKPAGLFSQAAPGVPSLEEHLTAQLKQRDGHAGKPFVGLPHRLDRATSGIMLVARNQRALARFGAQFQSRKIQKFYLALVEGVLPSDVQTWEDHVRKIENQPQAEIVAPDQPGAKQAQLLVRSLLADGGRSLLLVQLLTGRMHQIRVQAAHRGFPVVGDRLYGSQSPWLDDDEGRDPRESAQALHALRLEFRHPQTGKQMAHTAPPPAAWQSLPTPLLTAMDGCLTTSRQQTTQSWQL